MDYLKKSRIEEVLIAILGKGMVTSQLISRIEKILDAIRTDGSYDGPVMSEFEEILVCILNGEPFEKPTHSRIAAMLKVKANGGEYTELRKSRAEELIFEWINAVESATYTGTLPATLQTVEGYLESYKIYGDTVQDGTPTPENPIVPSGCGVRTENLCYRIITNATIDGNGRIVYDASFDVAVAPVYQDSSYSSLNPSNVYAWFMAEPYLGSQSYNQSRNAEVLINKTSPLNGFVAVRYIKANSSNAMIVEGSTAPTSYEPYGYKLPLTVNGVEYPIYLGESQTTRRIKKLVLTGEEGWARTRNKKYYIDASTGCPTDYLKQTITTSICSHYQSQNNTASGSNEVEAGHFCFYTGGGFELYIGETTISSAADFKTYLQQQYAAGTPVTIWYILKTEKTGIVNEPLMKIGDYADIIDSTQTSVQIPTFAGTTTISWAGEGLAPSEVELAYTKTK